MNTILWALSSKCSFHCKYCYLDFSEDNNPINNKNTANNADIDDAIIFDFIKRLEKYNVKRIFIAGAEPLSNYIKTLEIIKKIKEHNIQVILCTNGYLIDKCYKDIIESKVDALSISLDSYKKEYNDTYRQYPANDGFDRVVKGIKILKENSNVKIGIYTILTKLNLKDLEQTYKFVTDLKSDYFIFQPIFLNEDEKSYKELTLDENDAIELEKIIQRMYSNVSKTKLPNKDYVKKMLESIKHYNNCINNCFAGDSLFFITPDGSIHACPSSKMIPRETTSIRLSDSNLEDIFINKKLKIKECHNFSEDCVNMWQLMAFDEIL